MQTPDGYTFVTAHQVMVKDCGHEGMLYGGIMLQWLDEAGAMFADEVTGARKLVTKALDAMAFIHPARVGENVRFYARIDRQGTTSVRVKVKAYVSNPRRRDDAPPKQVTEVLMTFVSVDARGQKQGIDWTP